MKGSLFWKERYRDLTPTNRFFRHTLSLICKNMEQGQSGLQRSRVWHMAHGLCHVPQEHIRTVGGVLGELAYNVIDSR